MKHWTFKVLGELGPSASSSLLYHKSHKVGPDVRSLCFLCLRIQRRSLYHRISKHLNKREVQLSVFLGYKSLCRALVRQCKKGRVGARDADASKKIGSKFINMKSKLNQCLFILVINYLWKLYVMCLLI